jgi:hypothetical protein
LIFFFLFGVFIWGIEDLDLYSVCVVVVVLFFLLLFVQETICKREKKAFFITRRMNSSSLSWASYCSSVSDFHSSEEADAAYFDCLLLIFCCFQPNIESDNNALKLHFGGTYLIIYTR